MKKWIALLLAFALLAAVGCTRQRPAASRQTSEPAAEETKPSPEPEPTPESEPTQVPEPEPTPEPESEPAVDGTPEPNCFDALLGDWEIVSVEFGGETYDAASVGMQSKVTFLANGAGVIRAQARGEETEQIFTFGVYGTWIQMHDEENIAIDAYYEAETDTLRMIPEEGITLTLTRKTEQEPTPASDPMPEPESEPDWTQATLTEYEDNGNRMVSITATIPPHATLRIDFPNQDDYMGLNDDDTYQIRKVKIPIEVFYPNMPMEYAELEITPTLSIIDEDGTETPIDCPSFTVELPALSIAFPDAPEDGPYTVTVIAMKNNYVIASAEVTVAP